MHNIKTLKCVRKSYLMYRVNVVCPEYSNITTNSINCSRTIVLIVPKRVFHFCNMCNNIRLAGRIQNPPKHCRIKLIQKKKI